MIRNLLATTALATLVSMGALRPGGNYSAACAGRPGADGAGSRAGRSGRKG